MLKLLTAYGATAVVFLLMDMTWLTLTGNSIYRPVLGPLMAAKVDGGAAIAFYLIYIFGLVFFAVRPGFATHDWKTVALNGLVLGLVAYATYDLTNQATLRLWAMKITVLDLCWGMTASAVASTLGFLAAQTLVRGPH
ncbi:MAG TPA: DUF2177 family protein [Caulobacteraceae bacterium]|nr:DUF2177 family protein [Caulobacteraceae bacterium]